MLPEAEANAAQEARATASQGWDVPSAAERGELGPDGTEGSEFTVGLLPIVLESC